MSDEKLDLILSVVSEIKLKVDGLNAKTNNPEKRFDEAEIKAKIKAVNENIDRLEREILFARADSVDNRVKMRELETRLSKLENQVGLPV